MQFECGDRVCVSDYCKKYGGKMCGAEGVVMSAYPGGDTVGVSFPGYYNSASANGLYWINTEHLVKINEEEKPVMLKGYTAAGIKFLSGANTDKLYYFANYNAPILCPGDIVVLSTAHHGLALGRVESLGHPASYVTDNREIVALVDMRAYLKRQDDARRLAELTATMNEQVKEYQSTALYELVAEKNPAMRQLLDSYRELSGSAAPMTEGSAAPMTEGSAE